MPRRHNRLFHRIADWQALRTAARKAILGKRKKPGASKFQYSLEGQLIRLERELWDGRYRPGRYLEIEVTEPKKRIVSAAPFRDRVVHHALCAVVVPLLERGFIAHSFANQTNKGTHKAVAAYERYRDKHACVLRCDIFRYFPSIDHQILKLDVRKRIRCGETLDLIDTIINGSNAQEPVHIHFPGDDLLAPLERRRGLPIGNLTSQFFANVYLDPLDHFCTEVLGAPYVRYVDDFALFHDDPTVLAAWRDRIALFLSKRRLLLHPDKTFIASTREPSEFLGFVLMENGRRMLPEGNVTRFNGRLRSFVDRADAGTLDCEKANERVRAWSAHAAHAHTRRFRRAIFRRARTALAGKQGGPLARTV